MISLLKQKYVYIETEENYFYIMSNSEKVNPMMLNFMRAV